MEDRTGRIIEEYFKEKGIVGAKQVNDIEELVLRLLNEGGSHRKAPERTIQVYIESISQIKEPSLMFLIFNKNLSGLESSTTIFKKRGDFFAEY